MAFDTKPNLSDNKFEQFSGETLSLSGCTDIFGELEVKPSGSFILADGTQQDGYILTSDSLGKGTWKKNIEDNITKEISQTSHGFSVGNFIGWSGGTYNKAIADGNYDGEYIGIVSEIADVNTFKVIQSGYITGLTGLITNTTYFLSPTTAGEITATEPTTDGQISKPVLIADSTTSGWVLPYAGFVVSTGATVISSADNGLTDNNGVVELGGTLCKNTTIDGSFNINLGTSGSSLSNASVYSTGITTIYGDELDLTSINQAIYLEETTGIRILDVNSIPMRYNGDYSANISARSIPDAAWVTGNTGNQFYSANSPATCTVGGISPGYVLTGKTLECILQDAIAPYIEPTFSAFNVNVTSPMEVGADLSGTKTFTWSTTTSDNVATNSIGICEVGGSLLGSGLANDGTEALNIGTKTNTSPTTWTWQVTGCSTQNDLFSRNKIVSSIYPYYYGKLTSGSRPDVTNDLVTGGSKVVAISTSTVTVSFNSASNEYTWLAIPATSPSRVCWYVNALDNGLINSGDPGDKYPDECIISITSGQGCWSSVNYKVYMSGSVGEITEQMQFRCS